MKIQFFELRSFTGYAYSYTGSYLNLRFAGILFLTSVGIGIIGFMLIEEYTFLEAFYMTVITISTVGYTEVKPLTDLGRVFSSIYIILNIGIFAYTLSVFTNYVIEGEIFKKMHLNLIDKKIQQLENHIILCGYGKHGREIVDHFLKNRVPFVVIESDADKIEEIQKSEKRILYIEGDATMDENLFRAGLKNARALISSLGDDSDNVFTVLTARQLNKKINIISRSSHHRTERKLRLAGANHVIMPEQIGGFYMATLVSKPGAVEFFSHITSEYESDIGFEEVKYENLPKNLQGNSISDMGIRRNSGANIIGFRKADGTYVVSPTPDTRIEVGTSFIVLGNLEQLSKLKEYMA